ncbi:hypothetical protein ACFWPH_28125 [Nocardia sp. NPDC058499]|uniref:hypothetical protein n=1 Tax=Nocardia sp. NPDC058499 TaxID=3346530 RepID=UPI003664ED4D
MNQDWMVPVVITSVARDGMTVSRRVLDFPGALVWVFLGKPDGGLESRKHTHLVVLDPEVAWDLPAKLELERTPTQSSYRWPSLTEALRNELGDHTARDPGELRVLLERLAWRKNPPSPSPRPDAATAATPTPDSVVITDEHA